MDTATGIIRGNAPRRVMIVDDEELVRSTLSDLVELSGYQVCGQARDGFEATRVVNSADPDIILMDIAMPTMDGIEALQIINATRPHCALILSAHCSQNLMDQAAAAGAQGYLTKPCRMADLVPTIETAVEQFSRSRLAWEMERVDGLVERAWAHLQRGGNLAPAVERALLAISEVIGFSCYALLERRGARLRVLASKGLCEGRRGSVIGPVDGPLGASLRRHSLCRSRLVGAPAEITSILSAPLSVGPSFEGCLCFFAPEDHQFTSREERLLGATTRALSSLFHRAQTMRPTTWQRWMQQSTGCTANTRRRR